MSRRLSAQLLALVVLLALGAGAAYAVTGPILKAAHNPKLGSIVVNAQGLTLYHLTSEQGSIKCTGICQSFWLPVLVTGKGKPVLGKGVIAAKVGTIKRAGGKLQVTYNKLPLYRYYLDKKPGQYRGEGLAEGTGTWFAVSLKGTIVKLGGGGGGSGATTTGTTGGTTTGYGY
jgi:predicted lipoprotein with Yx(FWY)xxD motif